MNHLCDRFTLQIHAAQSLARIELPNTIEPFFLEAPFPVSAIRPSCTSQQLQFQALGARKVVGRFDAGRVSSDGGAMLLRDLALVRLARRYRWIGLSASDPAHLRRP